MGTVAKELARIEGGATPDEDGDPLWCFAALTPFVCGRELSLGDYSWVFCCCDVHACDVSAKFFL